jgi:hypothetical protein
MTKVLSRLIIVFFFLCLYSEGYAADSVYIFKEAHIMLNIPNSHWHLQPKQDKNGFVIYVFKRDPILDSADRNIIPNAAVVIEKIDSNTDIVTYSVNKRSRGFFSVTDMFNHEDGTINYINAVGYKGTYIDGASLSHTVYVVHAINQDRGLQIILDTTTETFPTIDAEFLQILKSVRKQID